jgi:biotin operon repressor
VSIKWLNYVWEESPYEGKKLLLHLALADYANDDGVCYPSQPTLAHKARVSRVWVRSAIKEMISDGLLEIEQDGGGRGNRTIYKLFRKRVSELPLSEIKRVSELPEKGNSNYTLTTIKNHQEPSICSSIIFDQFWKLYPRKVGKRAALKEFERVIKSKDAPPVEHLLNAVKCYAKNAPQDQRYIAHPTTWLRQGRWEDETATPQQTIEHDYERDNVIRAVLTMRNAGYDIDRVHNYLETKREDLREIGLSVFLEGITK